MYIYNIIYYMIYIYMIIISYIWCIMAWVFFFGFDIIECQIFNDLEILIGVYEIKDFYKEFQYV